MDQVVNVKVIHQLNYVLHNNNNNNNNNNNKILTKLNGDGNECDSNISEELDGGHPGVEEEGEGVVVQQTQQLHYCEIPTLSQELIENNNNNNNVNAYSYPPENDIDHFQTLSTTLMVTMLTTTTTTILIWVHYIQFIQNHHIVFILMLILMLILILMPVHIVHIKLIIIIM